MDGHPLRLVHLTTVDVSLLKLLGAELAVDVARGYEVYGLSAPGPDVPAIEALGVRHVPLRSLTRAWSPGRDVAALAELYGVLRRLRPHALHTHTPKAGVLGRVLGRLLGIPVVVNTVHGIYARAGDRPWKRSAVYALEGLAAQFSDRELYVSDADRATLARWVRRAKAQTVGDGVDLALYRPGHPGRAAVRRELGVADDEVLVGGVGRRVADKGIREFAGAARALAGRGRFIWVGPPDPDKPDALHGDLDGLEFVGRRDDMPAVHAALDVFVLPSYREGLPRAAMEAAARGAPLVLSDIPACRQLGVDGEHLLLVPAGDPAALTDVLRRLIDDAELRARLGLAARARAVEAFDQRVAIEASLATYRSVAKQKGLEW